MTVTFVLKDNNNNTLKEYILQYTEKILDLKDMIVKDYYENLDEIALYDGKDYDNMYMKSFLQMIADNIMPLTPVYIKGGWIEIDEPSDLNFGDFLQR